MSAPSIRAAALAFALSSWMEGLTQIRAVLLMPYLPIVMGGPIDEQQPDPASIHHGSWRDSLLAWLKRNGRDMDDTERTSLAVVDISTAFIILQSLGQPLLPFLLSPLLTTLPLPRSNESFKPIKWPHLFLTTLILTLVHEAERVSVSLAVECVRKRREIRNRETLGEVYVRGDEHRPLEDQGEDDTEQEECLICAGVGADTSLSQSISSLSSMATASAPTDALGPLEAFCTTAPQKHVAHRSCFLSWHAAYRQQRTNFPPENIKLQGNGNEATRTRAAAILNAAGFGHLSRHLRFPNDSLWSHVSQRAILILTPLEDIVSPTGTPRSLATLRTTIPPCPGCRSSVLLHFFSRPVSSKNEAPSRTRSAVVKLFARMWLQHWRKLVTGKTVLYRLASQWSFVMALLSMMRVSIKRVHWMYM